MAAALVQPARAPPPSSFYSKETAKLIFLDGRRVVPLDSRGAVGYTQDVHNIPADASGIIRGVAAFFKTFSGPVLHLGGLVSPLNIVAAVTGIQSGAQDLRHGGSTRTRLLGAVQVILKLAQGISAMESLPSRISSLASGILATAGKTLSALSITARVLSIFASTLSMVVYLFLSIKSSILNYEIVKFRLKLATAERPITGEKDPLYYLSKRTLVDPIGLKMEMLGEEGDWIVRLKEKGQEEFVKRLKAALPNEKLAEAEWKQRAEELAGQIPEDVWKRELGKFLGKSTIEELFSDGADPFLALGWELACKKAQQRKDEGMKRLLGTELLAETKKELCLVLPIEQKIAILAACACSMALLDRVGVGEAQYIARLREIDPAEQAIPLTNLAEIRARKAALEAQLDLIKGRVESALLPKIARHQWSEFAIQTIKVLVLLIGIAGLIMLCVSPTGAVGIAAGVLLLLPTFYLTGLDLRDLIQTLKHGEVGKYDVKLIAASLLFCTVVTAFAIGITLGFGLGLAPFALTMIICAVWGLSSIAMLIIIARKKLDPNKVTSVGRYLEYIKKENDPLKRRLIFAQVLEEAKKNDQRAYQLLRSCEMSWGDALFSQDAQEIKQSFEFAAERLKREEQILFKQYASLQQNS